MHPLVIVCNKSMLAETLHTIEVSQIPLKEMC